MFSTLGLVERIAHEHSVCCQEPDCIFAAKAPPESKPLGTYRSINVSAEPSSSNVDLRPELNEPERGERKDIPHDDKRRKLGDGSKEPAAGLLALSQPPLEKSIPFMGLSYSRSSNVQDKNPANKPEQHVQTNSGSPSLLIASSKRPISPPPVRERPKANISGALTAKTLSSALSSAAPSKAPVSKQKAPSKPVPKSGVKTQPKPADKPGPKYTLNPRQVAQAPADHGVRYRYLQALHDFMKPLNLKVGVNTDPDVKTLHLSDNLLIKLALDEEEKIAKENRLVYVNVIKNRLAAYKKMKLEDWVKLRRETLAPAKPKAVPDEVPPSLGTELSSAQELRVMLERCIADQKGLDKHGYVTSIPSEKEIIEVGKAIEAAGFFERCDRCDSRFQVFPNRRLVDGALTTNGPCRHHWGKKYFPRKQKADPPGPRSARYLCCNQEVGSDPCSVTDSHVFKASDRNRLAHVMQFEGTPHNPKANSDRAVSFDCEMGYTVHGLEIIRLTATSWPDGGALLDVLVRPIGSLLDLNTRFSGVSKEQFLTAVEYRDGDPLLPAEGSPLQIVSSPAAARSLFLSLISKETPLIGHAIDNDLNVIRLIHPTIVDTVLLFPHPKGLPHRPALRHLVDTYLKRKIQTAGAAGHDSLEDARATGDLVRWKVGKIWTELKEEGWKFEGNELVRLLHKDMPPDATARSGEKRKLPGA